MQRCGRCTAWVSDGAVGLEACFCPPCRHALSIAAGGGLVALHGCLDPALLPDVAPHAGSENLSLGALYNKIYPPPPPHIGEQTAAEPARTEDAAADDEAAPDALTQEDQLTLVAQLQLSEALSEPNVPDSWKVLRCIGTILSDLLQNLSTTQIWTRNDIDNMRVGMARGIVGVLLLTLTDNRNILHLLSALQDIRGPLQAMARMPHPAEAATNNP